MLISQWQQLLQWLVCNQLSVSSVRHFPLSVQMINEARVRQSLHIVQGIAKHLRPRMLNNIRSEIYIKKGLQYLTHIDS